MWRRLFVPLVAVSVARCLFPSLGALNEPSDATVDARDADADAGAGADAEAGVGSYVAVVAADAPASWWRLGEASTSSPAKDELAVSAGTYRTPGVTVGAPGAIVGDANTAARFDGTKGSMFLPGTTYDFGGTPAFAIEAWVATDAAPPADASDPLRRIVSHRTSAPYFGWMLLVDGSQSVVFQRWDQNAIVGALTSSTKLVTGKYSHVVVSSDGTTMKLYIDGAEVASGAAGTTSNVAAASLAWGSQSDWAAEFFSGSLDEPAIYTHALAPDRVLAHYHAGIAQ